MGGFKNEDAPIDPIISIIDAAVVSSPKVVVLDLHLVPPSAGTFPSPKGSPSIVKLTLAFSNTTSDSYLYDFLRGFSLVRILKVNTFSGELSRQFPPPSEELIAEQPCFKGWPYILTLMWRTPASWSKAGHQISPPPSLRLLTLPTMPPSRPSFNFGTMKVEVKQGCASHDIKLF